MKRLRIEQKQAPIPMAPDLVERISSAQNQVRFYQFSVLILSGQTSLNDVG